MNIVSRIVGVVGLLMLMVVWEGLARLGVVTPQQLPAPTVIAAAAWGEIAAGDLIEQALLTTRHLIVGYALATLVGIPVGFVLGRSRLLYAAVEPLIEFLRPMPVIAILPIALLILGLGDTMIYTVIAFGSGWTMLLHAMDGARGVDPILMETGATFRISRIRTFLTIVLPAAAPQTFTGLRVGLGIAVAITFVVELVSGFAGGLGDYVGQLQGALRVPEAYAGIITLALLGYVLGQILLLVETRLMAWHRGATGR